MQKHRHAENQIRPETDTLHYLPDLSVTHDLHILCDLHILRDTLRDFHALRGEPILRPACVLIGARRGEPGSIEIVKLDVDMNRVDHKPPSVGQVIMREDAGAAIGNQRVSLACAGHRGKRHLNGYRSVFRCEA